MRHQWSGSRRSRCRALSLPHLPPEIVGFTEEGCYWSGHKQRESCRNIYRIGQRSLIKAGESRMNTKKKFSTLCFIIMLTLLICSTPITAISITQLSSYSQMNRVSPTNNAGSALQELMLYNTQNGFVRTHTPLDPDTLPPNPNQGVYSRPDWDDWFTWERLIGTPGGCGCGCGSGF